MKFDTYLFGSIDVDQNSIITTPQGLPGFEDLKSFKLIHEVDHPETFTFQSLDDPAVAFQLVDPLSFGFHYELELSPEETAALKAEKPEDIAVMLIAYKREDGNGQINGSIGAPLLINTQSRIAVQKVIERVTNVVLSTLSSPAK